MAVRGDPGGICGLLDLIEEHRGAVEYDWRTRFGKGLDASVPSDIGWGEAVRLVRILRADPSSQLAAAVEGWAHPLERAGWMLADLIDIQGGKAAGKKWKTYPRPVRVPDLETTHRGNAAGRTPEEVKAILSSQFGQSA